MYIEDIQIYCRRALRGDKQALEQLGLDDASYPEPTPHNLSTTSLQITYNSVLNTAVAARELQLGFIEKQCELTLELLKAIAVATKITLQHEVDGQDVAEIMLALIHDEASRHNHQEVPEGKSDEELADQPTPPSGDENPEDPANSDEQTISVAAADGLTTAPADDQLPAQSSAHELPSTPADEKAAASTTAQKLPSAPADKLPSTPADEQPAPSTTAQKPSATPVARPSYSSATSKNKRRQCSLCPFFGTHLARHISAKHPNAARSKPERLTLVHHHDKLGKAPAGKKEVTRFQCTFKKCGAIITRLGQHLTRVHNITDKDRLKDIKSRCKRLPPAAKHQSKPKGPMLSSKKPLKRPRLTPTNQSSSSQDGSLVMSEHSSSEEHQEVDHHQLKVDADVDDISSFAETDDEEDQNTISATEQKKWADIYLAKNPDRNVREYFMSRFYRYLLHVEGGAHSERQALIHARQVHNIIATLDSQGTDLSCLAKRGGLDIWDKFCVPKLKSKELTGNSLKVYLRSMEYFVKFISKGLMYKQDMLNQRHKEVILALRDRLPDYRSTIHRRTGHQTTTRKVDEAFAKITPANIRELQASEAVKSAIKLIGFASEKKVLTHKEFILVRDYLLVTTLYENSSRPGPLENCLISRFKQATYNKPNDRYTILVDKHKTTRHHGPAELAVTSRIYSYLQIYLLHIRPNFAAAGEEALFIKDDGHAFRQGTIGRRVSRFFEIAGVRRDRRVTATAVRKMMSDKAYELSPTKKRLIHGHMKHTERTADANYVIRLNAERASKAHELMQTIYAEPEPVVEDDKADDVPLASKMEKADDVPLASKMEKVPADADNNSEDDDLPLGTVFKRRRRAILSSDESESERAETSSVSSLTNEHKSVLSTVFQSDIAKGNPLTIAEVRAKMRADRYLRKLVININFVKKIADYVRYKTNNTRHMQLTQLSELEEGDDVACQSMESGFRKTWDANDVAVIETTFEANPKVKTKKEILALFSEDEVLAHILEREGAVRCYEKWKNLLKRKDH